MLSKFRRVRGEKGFTLIELLVIIAIIGILAAIAIPQFSAYKSRAYQSDVKAHLNSLFLACKAYWADNSPTNDCTTAAVTAGDYGYAQSADISLTINDNAEATFGATASHASDSTSMTYTINKDGMVTP